MPRCAKCGTEHSSDSDACPACGLLTGDATCAAHPDRAAAARCVICGRPVCEECDSGEGQTALCTEHRTIPVIEGWAQVYSASSEIEAQLVSENLDADGIDAQVYSQRDSAFPIDIGELSLVRVLVPVWEYQKAAAAIAGHTDSEGGVAFACGECGESYEAGDESCTSCGAPL